MVAIEALDGATTSEDTILALENIKKRFGSNVTADNISIQFERGEFFTLLGPSGSGKSTILRMIAGLEQPDSGSVLLDAKNIVDMPPWKRGLGMVFQQYANFPHMDVERNISYGLRRLKITNKERTKRVTELLSLVGLSGFEKRNVTKLSGGEQQRVAIARALAPGPKILLLDEPLSALDEKIRREMQDELRRIQQATEMTFIYVTHDQEEALTMSDRVAVLNHGQCVQCDTPERIFRQPRTRFVANFFRGCNVLDANHEISDDHSIVTIGGSSVVLNHRWVAPQGKTSIAIRGEDIHIGPDAQNKDLVLNVRLESFVYRGLYTDYRVILNDGQILSAMTGQRLALVPSDNILIGIDRQSIVPLQED